MFRTTRVVEVAEGRSLTPRDHPLQEDKVKNLLEVGPSHLAW